jgi:hypothetical protein
LVGYGESTGQIFMTHWQPMQRSTEKNVLNQRSDYEDEDDEKY